MTPYELRWTIWRSADAFLQRSYKEKMKVYKEGHLSDKPEFPTYEQVLAYATHMKEFVNDAGKNDE